MGRSIRMSHEEGVEPFAYLFNSLARLAADRTAKILFDGKIIDIERQTKDGFNIGSIIFQGIEDFCGKFEVVFQNENIVLTVMGKP